MHLVESADLIFDRYMGVDPKKTDPVLLKYKDDILDFGYMSAVLEHYQNEDAEFQFADRANMITKG